MKKLMTWISILLVISVVLSGCVFGGEKRIGKDAALQAALADAGLTEAQIADIGIDLETERRSAWYEVEFESGGKEYDYKINAYTGEVVSARSDG